ncbi:MAG: hypothetical protein WBL95_01615 [Microcoleus sp.]
MLYDIAVFNRMRYKPIDALCPMPYALCPRPNPQAYLIEQRMAISLKSI